MITNSISFKGTFCIPKSYQFDRYGTKAMNKICRQDARIERIRYRDIVDDVFVTVPNEKDKKIQSILDKYSIPNYWINLNEHLKKEEVLKRFKLDEIDAMFGDELVEIDVKALDGVLKNQFGYVGYKGQGGSKEKYDRFKMFLHTKNEIKAPNLSLIKDSNGQIKITLIDGRHRFAVLRDMGYKKIPVQMNEESLRLGREAGIIPV